MNLLASCSPFLEKTKWQSDKESGNKLQPLHEAGKKPQKNYCLKNPHIRG